MTEKQNQQNLDLYELLQVHPKADNEIIKKAYHTIISQIHPDKGGPEEKTKLVNYAYEILTDKVKREQYDKARAVNLKQKLKVILDKKEPLPPVAPIEENTNCPVLVANQVLVADERGRRVLTLNNAGDITWQYGGGEFPDEILLKPKFASFIKKNNILIVDQGNNRVFEVMPDKKIIWQCGKNILNTPSFALRLKSGNTLITDTHRVMEIDSASKIIWQYTGKSGYELIKTTVATDLFRPLSAFPSENGNVIITDSGNKCVIEVNKKGKIVWQYPPKKFILWRKEKENDIFPAGINFAYPVQKNDYIIVSDKIMEITNNYKILWEYNALHDTDIHWAFKMGNNSVLIDSIHLVRRGLNQEVMLLDKNGKILWRYYYSQARII